MLLAPLPEHALGRRPARLIAPSTLRRSILLLLLLVARGAALADAQPGGAGGASVSLSIMGGGMVVGDSRLALSKLSIERGRWALLVDVTRDDTRQRWAIDDSRGEYVLWGRSAQLRRYTRDAARGAFVEVGAGSARASLGVTDATGARTDRAATIPMATWGLGARLGPGRAFVELGYRSAIVLRERHLHTTMTAPEGSTRDFVTYQSWYFERGRATGQPYLGLGLRF